MPQPEWTNIEAVLRDLETAPCDANGFPACLSQVDSNLIEATRKDLNEYLGKLLSLYGTYPRSGSRGVRAVRFLSALGWVQVYERYVPGHISPLREAMGLCGTDTAEASDLIQHCGALLGSFKEAEWFLRKLTGIEVSVSKLRKMTLAFGKDCVDAQEEPAPDVRSYACAPARDVKEIERTLFCMVDGGSANCCKIDTKASKGKNGVARTRQIRAVVFGEYGWLNKEGRPVAWPESFSYIVSGKGIDEVTSLIKRHGLARGSGTVPRMICLADGELALEDSLCDCFPHAVFINDFAHAAEHLHDCCMALGLEETFAQKEYRTCRGLLYRLGAKSVTKRLKRLYLKELEASADATDNLLYLEKREENMRYGKFRKAGYYIGTGHVEAAIRVLIVRRCKQAGMHWRHENAVNISAIHAYYRSYQKII